MPRTIQAILLALWCSTSAATVLAADKSDAHFQVNVDMVVLTLSVTDNRGKYVHGLKPENLRIEEEGAPQQIKAFAEGAGGPLQTPGLLDVFANANVFVLFDTSNWMYNSFAYASDAITEFVRHLGRADSVAVYKFSRNLYRAASLARNHDEALSAARSAVAGDDTALYNTLLLTVRDAAKVAGRKAVVVFSNGPDNASVITPADVLAVAEDEGVAIYIVSTRDEQKDPRTATAFQQLTARTGGRLFWAQSWSKQSEAFASIREDLANSYTVAYYPAQNSKPGFRRINVDIVSANGERYHVRTRAGYRVQAHSLPKPAE